MKKNQNYFPLKQQLCVFIVLIFFSFPLFSQQQKLAEIVNSKLSADVKIRKVDSLIRFLEIQKNDSLLYLYNDYAFWLVDQDSLQKAIFNTEKGLVFGKKNTTSSYKIKQLNAFDLAYYYTIAKQPKKAINAYSETIQITDTTNIARLSYVELAKIYLGLNDYYKAYDVYTIAVSLLKANEGNRTVLRDVYQDLSAICFKLRTKKSLAIGRSYGKAADSLAHLYPTSNQNKFNIKLNLALLHNEEENLDFDVAYSYYQEALQIAHQANDTFKIAAVYESLGDLYNILDQKKSIQWYLKAINLTSKSDSLILSNRYNGLGHTYSIVGDYEKSLHYRHEGLLLFTNENFRTPQKISSSFLEKVEDKAKLLFRLQQLAETYLNYFEDTKENRFLEQSITYFKLSDQIIDLLKTNSHEFKSRLFWRTLGADLYGKAIRASFLANQTNEAFYFMEKNKALLLLEDVAQQNLRQSESVSEGDKTKEVKFFKQLLQTKQQLKGGKALSKKVRDSLKKEEINIRLALSLLQDSIGISIQRSNFQPIIMQLETAQKSLLPNEIIVEYHISNDDGYGIYSNKENGYVILVTSEKIYLQEIPFLSELQFEVTEVLEALKKPFQTEEEIKSYHQKTNALYKRFFPTKEIRQLIQGKKVTLVPDSFLSLLPFEALSTSTETNSYLIQDTEVHYVYSNSFLQNVKKNSNLNRSYLGMAPLSFKSQNLPDLAFSKNEIENLASFYSGNNFLARDATKENFLSELKGPNIIHLATHANADGNSTPWIAFKNNKISLEELYLTENNASLVVLSGCNTSIGEEAIGEGLMSLARGFFYSGSQSVVASLWSIDDQSTAEIIGSFYKNLSNNQTKSEALHHAKLAYLNTHTLSDASPYYWAPLILLGENNTLPHSKIDFSTYIGIFLGIIFVLGVFYFFRSFRKTR